MLCKIMGNMKSIIHKKVSIDQSCELWLNIGPTVLTCESWKGLIFLALAAILCNQAECAGSVGTDISCDIWLKLNLEVWLWPSNTDLVHCTLSHVDELVNICVKLLWIPRSVFKTNLLHCVSLTLIYPRASWHNSP